MNFNTFYNSKLAQAPTEGLHVSQEYENIEDWSDEKLKKVIMKYKNKEKKMNQDNDDGENAVEDDETDFNEMDYKIMEFIETFNEMKKKVELVPTPVRISTQSAIGRLTKNIKTHLFAHYMEHYYWNLTKEKDNMDCTYCEQLEEHERFQYDSMNIDNIVGMKYNNITYGKMKKVLKKITKKTKEKRNFYNQTTFLVKTPLNERPVNIKIFSNGSISMTGCKQERDGFHALKGLVEDMKKFPTIFYQPSDADVFDVSNYSITLINSDFSIGQRIDRTQLYKIAIEDYGLFATYEPTIYPGVKITYMWNAERLEQNTLGICQCSSNCLLKNRKKEKANNICKKITIAVFQSGKIIITGSNNMNQTNDAYDFIINILESNSSKLIRFSVSDIHSIPIPIPKLNNISHKVNETIANNEDVEEVEENDEENE
jgi:TATA-box binding protein (TBP) (component of TFIID and TFIIIB)